ncbi:uncharacterized protein LOC126795186 isoform X1 [Argentina anserina]|uniref:uncharacterized protein LOC126795186 isoform X1 n=1 Tax=Argentina anserina TaxID=57926 RepID=UPI00217678E1|nr:uncharacterized protein LOC126795186 isoform X1 [Potentilla anserina]
MVTYMEGPYFGALFEVKLDELDKEGAVTHETQPVVETVSRFTAKDLGRGMWKFCILGAKLYILPDGGPYFFDEEVCLPRRNGHIFDIKTGKLSSMNRPAPKWFGIHVPANGKIYSLSDPYCSCDVPEPSFEHYDCITGSWQKLCSFPYSEEYGTTEIQGYAVCDGILLFSIRGCEDNYYALWAYDVIKNKWCPVEVEKRGCYFRKRAVVVDQIIYALSITPMVVVAFSITGDQNEEGDISYLIGSSLMFDFPQVIDWRSDQHLVHLGNLVFYLVQCGFDDVVDGCQLLCITKFQIVGESKINFISSSLCEVDLRDSGPFRIQLCLTADWEDVTHTEEEIAIPIDLAKVSKLHQAIPVPHQAAITSQPSYEACSSSQPPEPSEVAELFQQDPILQEKASSVAIQQVSASSKPVIFLFCPGKGKTGKRCTVKANDFFAELPDKVLYQYYVLKSRNHDAMTMIQGKELKSHVVILPSNNDSRYGDIKRMAETVPGLLSQWSATHFCRMHNQDFANIVLRINEKVGGQDMVLGDAILRCETLLSDCPAIVFGADVMQPLPGEDPSPSIAAVAASQDWSGLIKYTGCAQAHHQELIIDLVEQQQDPVKWTISGGILLPNQYKELRNMACLRLGEQIREDHIKKSCSLSSNDKYFNGLFLVDQSRILLPIQIKEFTNITSLRLEEQIHDDRIRKSFSHSFSGKFPNSLVLVGQSGILLPNQFKELTNIASLRLGEQIREDHIKKSCSLSLNDKYINELFLVDQSIPDAVFFVFNAVWTVNEWFSGDEAFGETKIDIESKIAFPSMRSIGNDEVATVNLAFLKRFELVLKDPKFELEVKSAVDGKKLIIFTGHSSGGAIAMLATIWFLEKYSKTNTGTAKCVTFGAPLVGNFIVSHALKREKWSQHFIHFVLRYDIVPRIMLAPLSSVKPDLQLVLDYFIANGHHYPRGSIATDFYTNVMRNTSSLASHAACKLMGNTNMLIETLSNFIKLSPYRPFGTYIFCTGNGKLIRLDNPDAVLQLLFYSCQLSHENEIKAIASKCLNAHSDYKNELLLERSLEENVVVVDELEQLPLASDGTPLDDLGLSTRGRLCLRAAGEMEKQKRKNQDQIEKKRGEIEEGMKGLEEYKTFNAEKVGYYDAFKKQDEKRDFNANVMRLVLAGIWDEIIEMLKRYDLPDEFEGEDEWIKLGTKFRRLVEPLDIANYYRHAKNEDTGAYMIKGRPRRYRYPQQWLEKQLGWEKDSCGESCFWAHVEELLKLASNGGQVDGAKAKELQERVANWIEAGVVGKDVLLKESTFRKLWVELGSLKLEHDCIEKLMKKLSIS